MLFKLFVFHRETTEPTDERKSEKTFYVGAVTNSKNVLTVTKRTYAAEKLSAALS